MQSKTRSKISPQEKSIFFGRSEHDKVVPVPNYTIPKLVSEHDSTSRAITRKGMWDSRREIPFYRPPPKPTEICTHVIPRKIPNSGINSLEQDINTDFEENSPHQEGVISEIYQRPEKLHFQEPPELQNLVNTGKLV